jgi:succinate dehydrogenase/fumarate reductase flavoprotein subunit
MIKKSMVKVGGISIPCYSLNTLIIGSGIAGLNTALCLYEQGIKDIAVVTDGLGKGTSYNAGSDKQTYYKLSLSGSKLDSPDKMAHDLFKGGCMHGDTALCEAVNSVRCFMNLVRLGVPFPHDTYGSYVGYKTDNDPLGRATSAGPLTSHLICSRLIENIKQKSITIMVKHEVIALLDTEEDGQNQVKGAVALDRNHLDSGSMGFVVFNTVNVILATGGPAGMYESSVYPESQQGSTGLAFEAGAAGNNLTESQFGLASVKFKWNLSGTYQQAIPRYLSTDKNGRDEKEFLNPFFPDIGTLSTAIFLKGYEWPFDVEKIRNYGSSLIDVLVYRETVKKGRRVFLDYTQNPKGEGKMSGFDISLLDEQAYAYLEKSGALFGTPVQRLKKVNFPAYRIFKDHEIDLEKERLEIAVCAQHNNGGLKANIWWESNVRHLFPVGEVCGTHGVQRPGGSSLNACQVGGLRAALFISKKYAYDPPGAEDFLQGLQDKISGTIVFARGILSKPVPENFSLSKALKEIKKRMSSHGAVVRAKEVVFREKQKAWNLYDRLKKEIAIRSSRELPEAFKCLDLCLTHAVYLEAVYEYLEKGGKSRGSSIVLDPQGKKPCGALGESWRFSREKPGSYTASRILEVSLDKDLSVKKRWVSIRPVPSKKAWFENVWRDFRNDKIIKEEI